MPQIGRMAKETDPHTRNGKINSAPLLAWYDRHRRVLPWRALPGEAADPYRVWLSEIMLQQTTVQAVKPYFELFTARWPRLADLAAAPDREIMKAWAGLGYYSRARNLLACARMVVERHQGRFPADETALRALPGIGSYTAAAIRSIAFDQRAVVVDGNVDRVITRLFRIEQPVLTAKALIRQHADQMTPAHRPGDHAQAMMDLGATICTPRKPACVICPLSADCAARQAGDAEAYPVKPPKAEKPHRTGAAFVAICAGHVLVRTRPPKGLLGGMTEFPGTDWIAGTALPVSVAGAPFATDWQACGSIRHVFTHFSLELAVFRADLPTRPAFLGQWVPVSSLDGEALPTLMRKVAECALRPPGPRASVSGKHRSG
jgi:A/G-specific adenine glycosylase